MKKRCPNCEIIKPATAEFFYRSRDRYDGLHWRCKQCTKKYEKTLAAKVSQKKRSKRKYEKYSAKPKARAKSFKYYGHAGKFRCAILNCQKLAEHLHHIDYDLPLDVIALCKDHHYRLHME